MTNKINNNQMSPNITVKSRYYVANINSNINATSISGTTLTSGVFFAPYIPMTMSELEYEKYKVAIIVEDRRKKLERLFPNKKNN